MDITETPPPHLTPTTHTCLMARIFVVTAKAKIVLSLLTKSQCFRLHTCLLNAYFIYFNSTSKSARFQQSTTHVNYLQKSLSIN